MVATNSAGLMLTLPSDREIVLTRVFDAPRRLVFEAHTRPEHVTRWWGPRGFTMPVCEMDFRPGGAWRFVEDRDGMLQSGMEAGAAETMDRLAEHLRTMA